MADKRLFLGSRLSALPAVLLSASHFAYHPSSLDVQSSKYDLLEKVPLVVQRLICLHTAMSNHESLLALSLSLSLSLSLGACILVLEVSRFAACIVCLLLHPPPTNEILPKSHFLIGKA